ncbi:SCO6745 family protein [Actinomycetospora sp. CA-053990]|uniref:SCO6745 family protein n=1 Tax=Actinomycetospora sp. CA-053990 TaxID=3239891 RepID=UPI003D8E1D0A
MDFAEARATFCTPRTGPVADPAAAATPARRLRDALEPLAMVTVWSEPAADQAAAAGLDFLAGYVGGRASVLGDVPGTVVASTFAVFEPDLAGGLWDQARASCSVAQLQQGRALAGVDEVEVDGVVDTLRTGLAAADLMGRPLFAGMGALPWPDQAHGRLWHATSLLREHRGDSHVAACVAAGLDGIEANVLTELWVGFDLLEYTSTRGWSPESMDAAIGRLRRRGLLEGDALSDEGRRVRAGIEEATDLAQQPIVDLIGDGLDRTVDALARWSEAVVARGWFPADPYKRAAG